jgi:hypothetical protein
VYVAGSEVWSVDGPGATPKKLVDADVTNLEMSPDGRAVALATSQGVQLYEGDAATPRVWTESGVHSVWFSRGGELAWASPDVACWWYGGVERRLVPVTSEGRLAALRFLRGGAGIVLSRGADVVRWSPDLEEETVLTSNEDPNRTLLGADVFGGGIVLWLGTSWQHHGRGT